MSYLEGERTEGVVCLCVCVFSIAIGAMLGSCLLSSEISDNLIESGQASFGSSHIYMDVWLNVTMSRYKIQSRAEGLLPSLENRNPKNSLGKQKSVSLRLWE